MEDALLGKHKKSVSLNIINSDSSSYPDSTSSGSYQSSLPAYNAPTDGDITSAATQDPNFLKGILEQEADTRSTDYQTNYGDAGHDTLISGTTDSIQGIIDSQRGDDTSQDPVPNLPKHKLPKTDDSLDFGDGFKLPRIEGFDDQPAAKPEKSQASLLTNGILGVSGGKADYLDQAEDVLEETFDQDV